MVISGNVKIYAKHEFGAGGVRCPMGGECAERTAYLHNIFLRKLMLGVNFHISSND